MKASDIFIVIMVYSIVFFSGGDLLYMVVLSAIARIGYMRLLEEEANPNGLFTTKKEDTPEEMRDGVKEE